MFPTCRIPLSALVRRNRLKGDLVWLEEKLWFHLHKDILIGGSFQGSSLGPGGGWTCSSGAEWILQTNTSFFRPQTVLFLDNEQERYLIACTSNTVIYLTSFQRNVATIFFTFTFCSGGKRDSVKLCPRKSPHRSSLWYLGFPHSLCLVSREVS